MKKVIAVILIFAAYQNWDAISRFMNFPSSRVESSYSNGVTLYSTSWCGYCTKARDFLKAQGISYIEYDIQKSAEGRSQYERLGVRGVPALNINGQVVSGYDPQKILRLIGR